MTRNGITFEQKAEMMREAHSTNVFMGLPSATFAERHYSVAEIGAMWRLSQDAVRKLFQNEPGVLVIGNTSSRHRRRYTTLRVPESVLQRVHRRMTKI